MKAFFHGVASAAWLAAMFFLFNDMGFQAAACMEVCLLGLLIATFPFGDKS